MTVLNENKANVMPDDDDESISEAWRKEDSTSNFDSPNVTGPDPFQQNEEQLRQATKAEQRRDRRLKSVLRELECGLAKEMNLLGRGKRGNKTEVTFGGESEVTFEGNNLNESQDEHFGNDDVTDSTPKPGGGTTTVVVEPDDAAHTVH